MSARVFGLLLAALLGGFSFPAHAQVLRSPCYTAEAINAFAEKEGFAPVAIGVDKDGDLVTHWQAQDGRFWFTITLAQQGAVCDISMGTGWTAAPRAEGQGS